MAETSIEIAGRPIGRGLPTYVIAELSANHAGKLETAKAVVRAAAEAGADAIKLQTYRPDTITIDVREGAFVVGSGTLWEGRTLYDLYAEAMTPWEWHEELISEAEHLGLHCFSSPFDASAIDFLETLDVPAYKIASFELIDHGLIARAAATGKPLIMSTGMASLEEIEEGVAVAQANGNGGVALLRCNSTYPAPMDQMDLRTITAMQERWPLPVGLSDHTMSDITAIAAVALGACIVEKHIILQRAEGGPDAAFSLEPSEFAQMVRSIREVEQVLGTVRFGPAEAERKSLAFRRSLYAVADIASGEAISEMNVRSIRPAGGLAPKHLPDIIGRKARQSIKRGTAITWEQVAAP
ncbi:MAG: pseudaminic acid synthase [Actinomycetia bacterium]|nr:pseudaminic acid synthase [Actinomycetes bacterium]